MSYKQMASLYDRLMINAPYDQWVTFTKHIFNKSDKKIESIADLGCGTGEITIKLAKEGYQTVGVDNSSDMLTYAQQKVNSEKLSISWVHQDLRELQGFKNLDAAVSYCDVMNYITTLEEVKTVFKKVASSLKTGGLFIFDIHSLDYVQHHLVNQTFTEVTNEISYIWNCFAGEELGEMYHELTFFVLDENGQYNRLDEFHHQRTYSINVYQQLLLEVGFEKPTLYSDFSVMCENTPEKSERIFFVAKKRSG